MKTIYYNHNESQKHQSGFRCNAEAWWVENDLDIQPEHGRKELKISESSYQMLFKLKVIEKFQQLPNDGYIDAYEEGILFNEGLSAASTIVREAASVVSDKEYDLLCAEQTHPEPLEYRIKIDGSQLRKELNELADFLENAGQEGYAIQLWL